VPGYGYSDPPVGSPLDSIAVADLWAQLMGVLGYARFGAAGGDIGSRVSRYLGLDHPERVVAVHRTDAGVPVFTGDIVRPPRTWLKRTANAVRVSEPRAAGTLRRSRSPSSTRTSCVRSSAPTGRQ
jgi:pimeloyl-ACP methyl ester carboxylesterase